MVRLRPRAPSQEPADRVRSKGPVETKGTDSSNGPSGRNLQAAVYLFKLRPPSACWSPGFAGGGFNDFINGHLVLSHYRGSFLFIHPPGLQLPDYESMAGFKLGWRVSMDVDGLGYDERRTTTSGLGCTLVAGTVFVCVFEGEDERASREIGLRCSYVGSGFRILRDAREGSDTPRRREPKESEKDRAEAFGSSARAHRE